MVSTQMKASNYKMVTSYSGSERIVNSPFFFATIIVPWAQVISSYVVVTPMKGRNYHTM